MPQYVEVLPLTDLYLIYSTVVTSILIGRNRDQIESAVWRQKKLRDGHVF